MRPMTTGQLSRECRVGHGDWWVRERFAGIVVMWCQLCGRRWEGGE